MRKRFEQQLKIGQKPISATKIPLKSRDCLVDLLAALKVIFVDHNYNTRIFNILEEKISKSKKLTGRKGMDLWQIFVLSQVRLCMNIGYDRLHHIANNDKLVRQIMGVEMEFGYEQLEYNYHTIYDNVTLLDDETIKKLNEIIIEFGHGIFKKKDLEPLQLKTDTFVVESNVHFPTDYNLLWDCARVCIKTISKFLDKYQDIDGWRKIKNWKGELKGLMRELGKASGSGGKNKEQRIKKTAIAYITKANLLHEKLQMSLSILPIIDKEDMGLVIKLEHFMLLMNKHIDLVRRRILEGEIIPHEEKMFSVFETYTEMIKKGKFMPNVEFGKKLAITTDQYHLIVDYQIMHNQQDRAITIPVVDRITKSNTVFSWSFDKGFWNKDTKEFLQQKIFKVVMPKLGQKNKQQEEEENARGFKKIKDKHSAIESNINELEHRGLNRCPDRGYPNFSRYIGLAVCAYNLKKIGHQILKLEREALKINLDNLRIAA